MGSTSAPRDCATLNPPCWLHPLGTTSFHVAYDRRPSAVPAAAPVRCRCPTLRATCAAAEFLPVPAESLLTATVLDHLCATEHADRAPGWQAAAVKEATLSPRGLPALLPSRIGRAAAAQKDRC